MAETNKSQMLSEAEIIEAINQDSLISVSLGAGQPQKNVKMSTLASVAAGLILEKQRYPFQYRGRLIIDANNLPYSTGGIYYAENGSLNVDNHIGPFLDYKADQSRVQFIMSVFSGTLYFRGYCFINSVWRWTDWKAI